ncbi:polymorphic toxin type 50 domain-containing protein [Chromobacterium vaccinii]|uniref:polymorphic toxin type 50 domain-containing protein n=1 Tax=Chromobacterium vaccinii TaxID=1108595 RepID=UPI000E1681EB|nr:polymorphic toxin type 50 domain-containing protein [Chromobacterium vaccinii]SUX53910.1 Protein of uncharacterised function (DUF1557) [Chromobacterium vaccinii]
MYWRVSFGCDKQSEKVGDILNWYKIQNHDKPLFEALDNINTASAIADAPAAVGGIIKLGIKGLTKAGVLEDIAVDVGKAAKATEKPDAALGSCMVPGSCFVAGTQVLTDKGLKAIEAFVGGEWVWSRSDQTGEYGFQPVVAHKATQDQAIYRVVVADEAGRQETLRTTAEHPFWIKDQGWLKASLLQTGMILVDHAGQPLTVVSQVEEDETEIVFNIQVAQFQTYHVGELGIWVHNAKCCPDTDGLIAEKGIGGGNPTIEVGKQGKHIPEHNNFISGKSELLYPNPQSLVDEYAGKGQQVGNVLTGQPGSKERVDFEKIIGNYIDPVSGEKIPTTKGIIHYSSRGVHIVPARP